MYFSTFKTWIISASAPLPPISNSTVSEDAGSVDTFDLADRLSDQSEISYLRSKIQKMSPGLAAEVAVISSSIEMTHVFPLTSWLRSLHKKPINHDLSFL
jgi:hypothetical protein